ncbi:MAG: glycosyltransferase family 4 protein [Endomicrobium sp.]|jgi:glycosyltransferase involved in cell wall biosynthesis|nr:glycosyltransferase family 4 protein [Endomicrobium sp.]
MLKVCYIITKLELGGAQKVALYTACNIDKTKFDDFLICGDGGILYDEAKQNLKTIQIKNLVREISPIKDFLALIQIYKVLKKEKPDIVHTHSSKAGIIGRIAAKLAGVKSIIHTIHGYGFNETQKFFVKYIFVYIEKFCAIITDKLIAVAREDIKKGVKYNIAKEDKFVLIRAGIDEIFFQDYAPSPEFKNSLTDGKSVQLVLTIGPFKPQKNTADFIKAAAEVLKEKDDVLFAIVGDGEQREQLETLANNLNIKDKILFLGWRKDIRQLLYASDIFVLTSLWEGLPCTIVEAMRCLKPVVANAVDGVKEIIIESETGFLIPPYDYKASAQKILYLLKNDSQRLKMGSAAQASIKEEFKMQSVVQSHEQLYLELNSYPRGR